MLSEIQYSTTGFREELQKYLNHSDHNLDIIPSFEVKNRCDNKVSLLTNCLSGFNVTQVVIQF